MIAVLRQRAVKHALLGLVRFAAKTKSLKRTEVYFGYGANLSLERFRSRQMNVEEIGNSVLENHEIKFTLSNEYLNKGYAGVHKQVGENVYGVTYQMDSLSLALLDTLEWCGFGAYERKKVKIRQLSSGQELDAWCYFVKYPKKDLFPSKVYLLNMIKSSKERGFPEAYIHSLKQHECREAYEIDHGFSLLFYGSRRPLEKKLRFVYKLHDQVQEKLCDLI